MSEMSILAPARVHVKPKMSRHRILVTMAVTAAILMVAAIVIYGFDYYWLSIAERPFSPKHHYLKPSGSIGISLGLFGFTLFLLIFLYPLRKKIPWLGRMGSAAHWLDFHVVMGCLAPIVVAFHASFKFQGFAGWAFWLMVIVAVSGFIGRYVYAQIPRSLHNAELSLKHLEYAETSLSDDVTSVGLFGPDDLKPLLRLPSAQEIKKMSVLGAVFKMIALDVARPFHVARLRSRALHKRSKTALFAGLMPSGNDELEAAISSVRQRSALAKRVAFLAKTQQVFHLWHVIHRPFSYSFAVFAIIHLVVVISLGYLKIR
jgi:hypothetical protein